MGRTKYRTRNSFIGGKRKASKRRGNSDVASRIEDTLMDQNMESASAKILNAHLEQIFNTSLKLGQNLKMKVEVTSIS